MSRLPAALDAQMQRGEEIGHRQLSTDQATACAGLVWLSSILGEEATGFLRTTSSRPERSPGCGLI